MNNNWGFAQIWNESLSDRESRPLVPRDNLWASELGKAPIDVWLKMKGVEPTNPPNARSLRKFEAGNVFEWIVSLILKRAGILQETQRWSSFQYPGLLKVTGKSDFVAGGMIDTERFEKEMQSLNLPSIFLKAGERIVKYLKDSYPDGLDSTVLEIKSTSSFMYDVMEKVGSAQKAHRIQTFHYLKSENRERANIIYISKDDLRMLEFPILSPSSVEEDYKKSIETISRYFLNNEKPPLEKTIIFDEDTGRFQKNFNVGYSGYLTMLYRFKDQKEFDDTYSTTVGRWNRVLTRIKNRDKLTNNNNSVIEEIKKQGFDIDKISEKFNPRENDEKVVNKQKQ